MPTASSGAMRSIVSAKWHLIAHETHGDHLYDWRRDPGEDVDQVNTQEGKAAAGHLRVELEGLARERTRTK